MKAELTKEFLYNEHILQMKSCRQIAKETGWGRAYISKILKKFGILKQRKYTLRKPDMRGEVFGMLTIIEELPERNGSPMYKCRCECGAETSVQYVHLSNGHTRSCGCMRNVYRPWLKICKGDKYGMLTVIEERQRINKERQALCRCDCGIVRQYNFYNLRSGHTRSCGCITAIEKTGFEGRQRVGYKEISSFYWRSLIVSARKRELPFEISIEKVYKLFIRQNRKCSLTGWDIRLSPTRRGIQTASLDRINSLLGYTIDNVQWVHKDVNKSKYTHTQSRFFEICEAVYKYACQNRL
jgi:hypothetical protein